MYDEHVVLAMHAVPLETQVDPQIKHYAVVVPYAAAHEVYKAH